MFDFVYFLGFWTFLMGALFILSRNVQFPGKDWPSFPGGTKSKPYKVIFTRAYWKQGFFPPFIRLYIHSEGLVIKPPLGKPTWIEWEQCRIGPLSLEALQKRTALGGIASRMLYMTHNTELSIGFEKIAVSLAEKNYADLSERINMTQNGKDS